MPAYPKLKLTYFSSAGRAEAIRLALHIGGVPFVDERLTQAEFAERKPHFVYNQVPVLYVDDVEMAQSQAILRYAGKLAGLYPVNDALAALQIDEILAGLDELSSKFGPSFSEQDPEKKKAMRVELANTTIPRYLSILDARLAEMKKNPVFQVDQVFIHELAIYSQYLQLHGGWLDHIPTDIADGHVEFMAATNKVLNHPKVQQWNAIHTVATPKLKLTYFDAPGRAAAIRMAFVIGGIPFEDERIERSFVAGNRQAFPFGQVPVLEINGQLMSQSLAILRYASTLAGLYPTNDPLLALRADEFVSLNDDISNAQTPVYFMADPEAKAAAGKKLVETTMPSIVAKFEKRIAMWGGPYAVGKTMTVADLIVYGFVEAFKVYGTRGLPPMSIEKFENVSRVYQQVVDHPKAKAWLAVHKP